MSMIRLLMAAGRLQEVDAVFFDGQSNCLGTGDGNDFPSLGLDASGLGFDLLAPMSRVLIYNYATAALESLNVPDNNMSCNQVEYSYYGGVTGGSGPADHPTWAAFGPELGYAYAWLQDHSTGSLLILKDSGDGQAISYFAAGTSRDALRLARHTAAKAALRGLGLVPNVKCMGWVQGEGDMGNGQSYYSSALTQRIADWRSDGTFNADTVLVLPQITPGSGNYAAAVNAAKVDIAATDPAHIKLIPYTDSRRGDNVHLTTYGALRQGANIYAAAYGVTPVALPGD